MKSSIEQILSEIRQASDSQLSQIVQAVIARYHDLFPDELILFLSLPKTDPSERRRILEQAAGFSDDA